MTTNFRCRSRRIAGLAAVIIFTPVGCSVFCCAGAVGAEFLAYSFETGLEGFTNNGGGTTVTLDTIGATQGTNSLKFSQVTGATFTGMITTQINPTIVGGSTVIGDPPGIDYILFDLTLPNDVPPTPPGMGFARASVTVFGSSQPDYPGGQLHGLQAQFFDNEISIAGPAGLYRDLRIDLTSTFHPLTFESGSFNDVFGTVGSGQNDVIPVSFQIYINKNNTFPLTVYVDNIRVGINMAGIPGDYNDDSNVDAADYVVWRKNEGTSNMLPNDPDGGMIGAAQYQTWQENFGGTLSGSGGGGAVPEPASALLLVAAALCHWGTKRHRAIV